MRAVLGNIGPRSWQHRPSAANKTQDLYSCHVIFGALAELLQVEKKLGNFFEDREK